MKRLLCRVGLHKFIYDRHVEPHGHTGFLVITDGTCLRCGKHDRYTVRYDAT